MGVVAVGDAPDRVAQESGRARRRTSWTSGGRHCLTKAEINALSFATYQMKRPRGWDRPFPVGRYWRAALVVFFNYRVDTGTVWKSAPFHEPILWRHVTWDPQSPNREVKVRSRWGWLFYRRVKTGKIFYRPPRPAHSLPPPFLPDSEKTLFADPLSRLL
jgi:hypothetical protein